MTDINIPFTPDVPTINPESIMEDITRDNVENILGTHTTILYIGNRQVKVYVVNDIRIYMWTDSRGRENSVFISGEYTGNNHQVDWYRGQKNIAKTMMKVTDQRGFIERCVQNVVKPENIPQ